MEVNIYWWIGSIIFATFCTVWLSYSAGVNHKNKHYEYLDKLSQEQIETLNSMIEIYKQQIEIHKDYADYLKSCNDEMYKLSLSQFKEIIEENNNERL